MAIERLERGGTVSTVVRPDFAAVRAGHLPFAESIGGLSRDGLARLTDELHEEILAIVSDASDAEVGFVPRDPAAATEDEAGWTIAHVVGHLTATCEEAAAQASSLARGIVPEGRSRYEVPEEELAGAERVRQRLMESQRICRAFLEAWPERPHMEVTMTIVPQFGPLDAIGRYALGLLHGDWHLEQLRETLRQAWTGATG